MPRLATYSFALLGLCSLGSCTTADERAIEGRTLTSPLSDGSSVTSWHAADLPSQTGAVVDVDGARVREAEERVHRPGHMVFGPYARDITAGNKVVLFDLASSYAGRSNTVATIDVNDATTDRVLAQRNITGRDFAAANRWKTIQLPFTAIQGHALEFRVFFSGKGTLRADAISVYDAQPIEMRVEPGRIISLKWRGTELLGGYYIIGSCTGKDDPANNVSSYDTTDGTHLSTPGSCPGAPFTMDVTGYNPIHVKLTVGPLPADYAALSVPMDPHPKSLFSSFAFDGQHYAAGCGHQMEQRDANGGTFDSIPRLCTIEALADMGLDGRVGLATVTPTPGWGEITGSVATIRRIPSGSGWNEVSALNFFSHPDTNNIEPSFATAAQPLRQGSVFQLEEDIWLSDPRPSPSPNPGPIGVVRSRTLLPLLYQGILARTPDASGQSTYSPRIDQGGVTAMKQIAGEMIGSREFATRRTGHANIEILTQFYRGILGRGLDTSGQASYLPLLDRGRYAEVVDNLLSSREFLNAHPEAN